MTQISKKIVKKDLETEINEIFWSTIARFNKKDEVTLFFSELFTYNERVNLAKRIAIAILLSKGYDWRSIKDLIKVSEGTIAKISARINSAGFKLLFKKLENDARWRMFWNDLVKTYLIATHPDKYARLGDEGVEKVILKKKNNLLH
ncbi:hypothetical protein HY382_02915 [Candidatus Curtissbacteria bacterium]|nr:hypothetical protein [Candidatus Curtissbacteria bacterium]